MHTERRPFAQAETGEMRMTQSEPKKRVRSELWVWPPWPSPRCSGLRSTHMPRHIIIFLICVCGASVDGVPTSQRHHALRYNTPLCPSTVPRFAAVRLRERDWQARPRARGGRPRASDRSRASSNASQRPLSVSSGRGDAGWRSERGRAAGVEGGELLEHRERDDRVRRQLDKGGHEAAPEHENAVGGDAGARALER